MLHTVVLLSPHSGGIGTILLYSVIICYIIRSAYICNVTGLVPHFIMFTMVWFTVTGWGFLRLGVLLKMLQEFYVIKWSNNNKLLTYSQSVTVFVNLFCFTSVPISQKTHTIGLKLSIILFNCFSFSTPI